MKIKKEQKLIAKEKIVKIACKKCRKTFGIGKNYIGIINCPYCQTYVEG